MSKTDVGDDNLVNIQNDLLTSDPDFGYLDRGEAYLRIYLATAHPTTISGSPASVVEGNISTFSGLFGGTAYLANYVLADKSEFGGATYPSYTMENSSGINDIYKMSNAIAANFLGTALNDPNHNGGNLSIVDGITAASNTWSSAQDNGIGELGDEFPGNIFTLAQEVASSGLVAGVVGGPVVAIVATIATLSHSTNEGDLASFSGTAGSILFGKSVSDFQGRHDSDGTAYAIIPVSHLAGATLTDEQYVLHYSPNNPAYHNAAAGINGDRNGDGIIDYQDGTVVMIQSSVNVAGQSVALDVTNPAWEASVDAGLAAFALDHGVSENTLNLNWNAYRSWSLMSDFRAQQVPGGEYDFVKYAESHGAGAQKDFWNYTETLLDDTSGVVRNAVITYDRTETGTTGDDYLYGGSGKDVLNGGDGNDTIRAGWNDDKISGGNGNDQLYGEAGNDVLVGGQGNDLLDGGPGTDTADYSQDPNGIHVTSWSSTGNGNVSDGWGTTDTLVSIEKIIGSTGNDTFNLSAPGGHVIDGNGGNDIVNYSTSGIYDKNTGFYWNSTGTAHDTLISIPVQNIHAQTILPSTTHNEGLSTTGQTNYDYSGDQTAATIHITAGAELQIHAGFSWVGFGTLIPETYTASSLMAVSVDLGNGVSDTGESSGGGTFASFQDALNELSLTGGPFSTNLTGTNHGDTVTIDNISSRYASIPFSLTHPSIVFSSGSGDDDITIQTDNNATLQTATIEYRGGHDVIHNAGHLNALTLWEGISLSDLSLQTSSGSYADGGYNLTITAAGFGSETLEDISAKYHPSISLLSGGGIAFDLSGAASLIGTSQFASAIKGTWGDDTWTGRAYATQTFYGYGGNDTLTAGLNAHDTIYGGSGHSTMVSESGVNALYGGSGDNIYEIGRGSSTTIASGQGTNTVSFTDSALSDYTLVTQGSSLIFLDSASHKVLTIQDTAAFGNITFADGQSFSAGNLYTQGQTHPLPLNSPTSGDTFSIKSSSVSTISETKGLNSILVSDLAHTNYHDTISGNTMKLYANSSSIPFATINGINTFSTITFSDGFSVLVDSLVAGHPQYIDASNGTFNASQILEPISVHMAAPQNFSAFYGSNFGNIVWTDTNSAVLTGGPGNDIFHGGPGGTVIYATAGNNTYLGDPSADITLVNYINAPAAIVADLNTGVVSQNGYGGTDTLANVHVFQSGYFGSHIIGSAGNDSIGVGGGNNVVDGGLGINEINYAPDQHGVTVNLLDGTANNGTGTDVLTNIQNITGSFGGENNLTGDNGDNTIEVIDGNNVINGMGGNDTILITGSGNNIIDGGPGNDLIQIDAPGGHNTIVVKPGDGIDTIVDNSGGGSAITFKIEGVDPSHMVYSKIGNDLVVTYDDSVTIHNYYAGTPSAYQLSFDNGQTISLADAIVNAPVNHNPVAVLGEFTDAPNHILTGNVLVNNGFGVDSDPDGDPLSVLPQTAHTSFGGAISFTQQGNFTYTPPTDFTGTDSFTYTLQDGKGGAARGSGNVSIQAQPIVAENDDFTGVRNHVVSGNVLSDNGHGATIDPNGSILSVGAVTAAGSPDGTLTLNGDGSFIYTPALDFLGTAGFTYTVLDDFGKTAAGTVNIAVTEPPPTARPDDFTGVKNMDIEGNLLANNGHGADFDVDGDTLKIVQNMISSTAGGSVILMANGDFVYMPPANFVGTDTFNYTVTDGQGGSAVGTATLTMAPPPNLPPVAEPDQFDSKHLESINGNVLLDNGHGADHDPNGDPLSVQPDIFKTVNGGAVTLNADGSFVYTPKEGFVGTDSFTYVLKDGQGGTATGVVTLDVTKEREPEGKHDHDGKGEGRHDHDHNPGHDKDDHDHQKDKDKDKDKDHDKDHQDKDHGKDHDHDPQEKTHQDKGHDDVKNSGPDKDGPHQTDHGTQGSGDHNDNPFSYILDHAGMTGHDQHGTELVLNADMLSFGPHSTDPQKDPHAHHGEGSNFDHIIVTDFDPVTAAIHSFVNNSKPAGKGEGSSQEQPGTAHQGHQGSVMGVLESSGHFHLDDLGHNKEG